MDHIKSVGSGERSLSEKAADQITQLIIDEAYAAGSKLPNEFELAARLGVGRSTVREAIKSLCSRNILEIRHGSGTFVTENVGEIDDPLGFRFFRNKKKLALDLCQIRLYIEPELAAAAAQNADAGAAREMQDLADAVASQYRSGGDHAHMDVDFHTAIARATGNDIAPRLIAIIATSIPLFINLTKRALKDETIKTHQQVVQAIARRNARRAKSAMARHIMFNQEILENLPE